MKRGLPIALVAGVAAAFAVAGFPALAAVDHSVAVGPGSTWNGSTNLEVAIPVGDTVTWSNSTGTAHGICVRAVGASSGCGKYGPHPAPPSGTWTSASVLFDTDNATYDFVCTVHSFMKGTVKVGTGSPTTTTGTTPTGTGTGTGTTPTNTTGTNTTPTNTTGTNTTPTNTTPAGSDSIKPRFVGAVKRKGAKLSFQLSEKSKLTSLLERRAPGAKKFKKVARKTTSLAAGKRTLALAAKLKKGAYRVTLVLADAAGNKSAPKVLKFKVA
jgi:plastocyanin